MPPLVIASAHTQGTLVSFLQSFESCHGLVAPFSYSTSCFYLCGSIHIFFCTPTPKFEPCCLAVLPHFLSFFSVCMLLSLSVSHYSINWRCCIWGFWWSSCSLPLRPINRSLIHASFCLLHLHHWESLVVAPQQVKWAFSIQLMIISHSLNLNVSRRASHCDAIPPHLHIFEPQFTKGVECWAAKILFCSFCLDICMHLLSRFCFSETGKSFLHPHDLS